MQLQNKSVFEYLLQIQTIVDPLGSIGVTISSNQQPDVILEGLPRDYESTKSLICSKFETLSIDEVETLVLGHEARLDRFQKHDSQISVNLTQGASSSSAVNFSQGASTSNSTAYAQPVQVQKSLPSSSNGSSSTQTFDAQAHLTRGNYNNFNTSNNGNNAKMVTDFLILAKVDMAMEAAMEEEAMLVEEMVEVVVGLPMFNAKFVTNFAMKLPFATIAMKKIVLLHSPWFMKTHKPLLHHSKLLHSASCNLATSITTSFFCSTVYAVHGSFSILLPSNALCAKCWNPSHHCSFSSFSSQHSYC